MKCSVVLNQATLVLFCFYALIMKLIHLLIMVLKLEVLSWMSKTFDKVWYEGQHNSTLDNLLNVLSDFLRNRKQGVMLFGQPSSSTSVNAGVPQRSILGPLLFLIYINDLSDILSSNAKLFSDTSISSCT